MAGIPKSPQTSLFTSFAKTSICKAPRVGLEPITFRLTAECFSNVEVSYWKTLANDCVRFFPFSGLFFYLSNQNNATCTVDGISGFYSPIFFTPVLLSLLLVIVQHFLPLLHRGYPQIPAPFHSEQNYRQVILSSALIL